MGYTRFMDRDAVRACVDRDWAGLEQLKREYHARRVRSEDPVAGFRLSQQLRDHMRSVVPEWPTPEDRDRDFAHHLELKRKLDGAARGVARR